MTFIVVNPLLGESTEFEDAALANAKAEEIRAVVLAQEAYRFTVAKEIVEGGNVTWMNADLDNDPEDGRYQVFNTFVGQHEPHYSLSAAKARKQQLVDEFSNSLQFVFEPIPSQEMRIKNAQSMADANPLPVTQIGG